MSAPTVIGLDLSITATGLVDDNGQASTINGGRASLGDDRLHAIATAIEDSLTVYVDDSGYVECVDRADLVVIEGPVLRSAAAISLGMLHGAVRLRLMDWGVPYVEIPPATLKKYATGKGNADKTAMALALYKRAGLELADDNQVDAWWRRAAGMQRLGAPVVDLPAAQIAALEKVRWPVAASAAGEGEA